MRRSLRTVGMVVAFGPLISGCGGSGDAGPATTPAPSPLTASERRLVTAYEGRIQAYCVAVARSLADPRAAPSADGRRDAFAAADDLGALAARRPGAPLGAGQDLRLYLSDVVENLEGSNCDPAMVARLERALAAIPNE